MSTTTGFLVSALVSFAICQPDNIQTIVGQLNTLLDQPGWQYMDVCVKKETRSDETAAGDQYAFVPAPDLLEMNRRPGDHGITPVNVFDRYRDVLTVLQCKYAEVTTVYGLLIKNLVDTCRLHMYADAYDFRACYDVVLNKLGSISVTFRYMRDALDFFETLSPAWQSKQRMVLTSLSTIEAFTRDITAESEAKLRGKRQTKQTVKQELYRLHDRFIALSKQTPFFLTSFCLTPHQVFAPEYLAGDYVDKTKNQQLSWAVKKSLLDFLAHKVDSYSGHIIKKWFYRLGFRYGATQDAGNAVIFNRDILS